MEETLPPALNELLTKVLLDSKEGQLLLTGYLQGKGFQGKFKITGTFTVQAE